MGEARGVVLQSDEVDVEVDVPYGDFSECPAKWGENVEEIRVLLDHSVIEIDVPPTDAPIPRDHLWPEAVPCIDAAVICYNSADRSSFRPVETLLREPFSGSNGSYL